MVSKWQGLLTAAVFLCALAFFWRAHPFYVPAEVLVAGHTTSSGILEVSWDSGSGFTAYERVRHPLQPAAPFQKKIALPQVRIDRVSVAFLPPETSPPGAVQSQSGLNPDFASVTPVSVDSVQILGGGRSINLLPPAPHLESNWIFDFSLDRRAFHWIRFLVQCFMAGLLAWAAFGAATVWSRERGRVWSLIFWSERRWIFWGFAVIAFVAYSVWLLTYWPAAMTNDSWFTIGEVQTLNFDDANPYLYVLYLVALMQLADSPAIIGVFQMAATALLGAYVFYYALQRGVRLLLVLPFALLWSFSIPIGLYNVTLWKDIPFSIALTASSLLLYLQAIRCEKSGGRAQPLPRGAYLPALLLFIAVCQFRHNGLIFYLVLPALVWPFLLRGDRLRVCALSGAAFLLCNVFVPAAMGVVKSTSSGYHEVRALLDMTTHYNFYSTSRERDFATVSEMMGLPWAEIKANYPQNWFSLWDRSRVASSSIWSGGGDGGDERRAMILRLLPGNIPIYLTAKFYESLHSMGIDQSVSDATIGFFENPVQLHGSNLHPPGQYLFGVAIAANPPWPSLRALMMEIDRASRRFTGIFSPQVLIWNLAIYLLIFSAILFFERGFSAISVFILPSVAASLAVYLVGAGESWRYFYYVYLTGVLVIPLYLAYLRERPRAQSAVSECAE